MIGALRVNLFQPVESGVAVALVVNQTSWMVSHTCEYFDCTLLCIDTFVCDVQPASAADAIIRPAAQVLALRLIAMRFNPFPILTRKQTTNDGGVR